MSLTSSPSIDAIKASLQQERDALASEIQRSRVIANEVAKAGGLDAYVARLNVLIGQEQAIVRVLGQLSGEQGDTLVGD